LATIGTPASSYGADVAGAVARSLAAAAAVMFVSAAVRAVVSAAFSDASAATTAASNGDTVVALCAAACAPTFVLAAATFICALVARARSLPLACLLLVTAVVHVVNVAACVVVVTVAARTFVRTVVADAAVLAAFAGFGSTDISDRSPPLTPRRIVTRRLLFRELRVLVPGAQHE